MEWLAEWKYQETGEPLPLSGVCEIFHKPVNPLVAGVFQGTYISLLAVWQQESLIWRVKKFDPVRMVVLQRKE